MAAKDASMTLQEFGKYYREKKGLISKVTAYDTADRKWVGIKELLEVPGAYTLIVIKFKNNQFLRVSVKPSLNISLAPHKFSSPATWKPFGIELTFDEKEFLESIGSKDATIEELIKIVLSSNFTGKEQLAKKLKKAKESL
jgi:hypothetical protein